MRLPDNEIYVDDKQYSLYDVILGKVEALDAYKSLLLEGLDMKIVKVNMRNTFALYKRCD